MSSNNYKHQQNKTKTFQITNVKTNVRSEVLTAVSKRLSSQKTMLLTSKSTVIISEHGHKRSENIKSRAICKPP